MTTMEQEAREAPKIVARQLQENEKNIIALCKRLVQTPPPFAVTIGRGSSDHACSYAKYVLETTAGLITSSGAPSVISIYKANLNLKNSLVIGISQSGKSPDICSKMEEARKKGATTVAIVNDTDSPLANFAEFVIPLHAGKEKAVAATKSYIASLAAIAQFAAIFTKNQSLLQSLKQLPAILEESLNMKENWNNAIAKFSNVQKTLVIARGFGYPIAQEAALKFKETASIQAEAFSSAEVLHGPFALIEKGHPYLIFAQNDASLKGTIELMEKIKKLGGKSILALAENCITDELRCLAHLILRLPISINPILDPIVIIQAFYPMVAKLAVARGYDPDSPTNLQKVTETM